jgi:hypothetical protein
MPNVNSWNKRSEVQEDVEFGSRNAAAAWNAMIPDTRQTVYVLRSCVWDHCVHARHRRELDVSPEMPLDLLNPCKDRLREVWH